jgi:hypothetical protein
MQTLSGFFRDLGWGVTIGIVLLLVGAPVMYFVHWGETKKETASRLARDAARVEGRNQQG